ncbi:MAG: hypothetical protein QNJ32_19990 [Xenococcaceae cyanobacterium MO_167.B27]|nr:hypothetical protein [Xenococcaceae cyanobacterium MO_167.B27]
MPAKKMKKQKELNQLEKNIVKKIAIALSLPVLINIVKPNNQTVG